MFEVPLPAPDGKNKTISAETRSWEKAEQQAQEIRDSWDPVKQRFREYGVCGVRAKALGPRDNCERRSRPIQMTTQGLLVGYPGCESI